MAGQRFVLTMVIAVTIMGYVAGLGVNAYDGSYDPGNVDDTPQGDSGILSFIGSGIADVLSGMTGFLQSVLPAITGITLVDQIITNGLATFLSYKALVFARGGGG